MVSDVVSLFGILWFPVFFMHREKPFDVFRLIFFSFNVIANLNFLVTTAWYIVSLAPFIYSSCHRWLLRWNSSSFSLSILPLCIFLCITILLIPCNCALQGGRWYFVFVYLDFCTEICLALAINRYNRPVTLSLLSSEQLHQHLLGTC